ncbi:MAG: response regulator [Bacteroides sp.]|nr:response regulator [Bacteroides sp.]
MYHVMILDDNRDAIEKLKHQLKEYTHFRVVATASDGTTGKTVILKERPHLLFLDIELPDMDAFELIRQIGPEVDWNMEIVFYTAYNKYVIKAIRSSAFDYLVKPVNKHELDETLGRFCQKAEAVSDIRFFEKAASIPRENIVLISTVFGKRLVHLHDIGLILYHSASSQWEMVLTDESVLRIRHKISARKILAFSDLLVKVNQSCIVNINYLRGVENNKCVFRPPFSEYKDIVVTKEGRRDLEGGLFIL